MPWTIQNPPPPAKNWPAKKKRACVSAANAALRRGDNEEDAIYACIGAAENVKQYEAEMEDEYERLVTEAREDMTVLGEQVASGDISPDEFKSRMRDRIKTLLIALALLGSAGAFSMDDELAVEDLTLFINSTYALLDDFIEVLTTEDPSPEYTVWRAGLYANHRHVFIRYILPRDLFLSLPAFPGISCLGDGWCGCWLEYDETPTGYEVYWFMNPAKEHCEVCIGLEAEWSPLVVDFNETEG